MSRSVRGERQKETKEPRCPSHARDQPSLTSLHQQWCVLEPNPSRNTAERAMSTIGRDNGVPAQISGNNDAPLFLLPLWFPRGHDQQSSVFSLCHQTLLAAVFRGCSTCREVLRAAAPIHVKCLRNQSQTKRLIRSTHAM